MDKEEEKGKSFSADSSQPLKMAVFPRPVPMKIRVQRKTPVVWAVEVQGRHLAPAIYQFDNLPEIREICEGSFISWEDVVVDQASGLIKIPGVGAVTLGCYLIENSAKGLEVYDSLEALQRDYKQVEE